MKALERGMYGADLSEARTEGVGVVVEDSEDGFMWEA